MLTESEKVAIEPEVRRPEVVRVRKRRVRQEPSPKTRKMTRSIETGSRATGTGSSATDDVSSVILGNLIQNPLFYATTASSPFTSSTARNIPETV